MSGFNRPQLFDVDAFSIGGANREKTERESGARQRDKRKHGKRGREEKEGKKDREGEREREAGRETN